MGCILLDVVILIYQGGQHTVLIVYPSFTNAQNTLSLDIKGIFQSLNLHQGAVPPCSTKAAPVSCSYQGEVSKILSLTFFCVFPPPCPAHTPIKQLWFLNEVPTFTRRLHCHCILRHKTKMIFVPFLFFKQKWSKIAEPSFVLQGTVYSVSFFCYIFCLTYLLLVWIEAEFPRLGPHCPLPQVFHCHPGLGC